MSAFDVLERFGTAALLRFLGAVAVFVLLHLVRLPLLTLARLLEVGMRRVDGYLTAAATAAREPNPSHTSPPLAAAATPAAAGTD